MAEILYFEILRKHGQTNKQTHTHTHTHTNKHTHKQTHRHGHYNTSPSPYGGRGNYTKRAYGKVRRIYTIRNLSITVIFFITN